MSTPIKPWSIHRQILWLVGVLGFSCCGWDSLRLLCFRAVLDLVHTHHLPGSRICLALPCAVPLALIISLLLTECGLADFGESALQFMDSS